MHTLTLCPLGRTIRVDCREPETLALLTAAYGHMNGAPAQADLHYTVGRDAADGFFLERRGRERLTAVDDGTFLALFDEDFAIELQKLRPDLYFVHAAVLARADSAFMLVTESGGGKSTLCWALAHHGYRVLSDELGPIDLDTLDVHPFPRALMLKTPPPQSLYPTPPTALRSSRGWHVSAADLPGGVGAAPARLCAIFFLRRDAAAGAPSVRTTSAAEGVTRLYANSLNQLAHRGDGLDAAIRIATGVAGFELATMADLPACCDRLTATLQERAYFVAKQ